MPPKANCNRTALIFTINACMFIFGFVLFLMGTLLPSLHVSYAQAGSLGSFPLIGILIASVLVGPVLDIHGAKQVLILALILIAGSLALIPSLQLYWQLAICCLAYGFGGGVLNTAANVLIADLHVESRASALNLLGFFFSVGAVLAPLLMSTISGELRPSIVLRILAALTAAVLIPVTLFEFPPPLKAGVQLRNLFLVLNQPAVWLFGILLIFESGSENCMFVWSSKIAAEALHTTPAQANLALVGLSVALGIGRLIAVFWLHWLGNLGTIWLSTSLVLVGVSIALTAHGLFAMVSAMTVIGLGISAIFPTVLGLAGDRFSCETGTVFGTIIALGLVGGVAGPTLGGHAIAYGPLHVLWIPAVSAVAVAVLTAIVGMQKARTPNKKHINA
ncbi:MAG TPA: MFS transporter [Acidobacteriaceae bacterium]|nr:MFS transporter [Acidobacteriaceae bacterium]